MVDGGRLEGEGVDDEVHETDLLGLVGAHLLALGGGEWVAVVVVMVVN